MGGPCAGLRHKWGKWWPLTIIDEFGEADSQYRVCERCNRQQNKHWWNR